MEFMEILQFSWISMAFMDFPENCKKVEHGPAAAHHAQTLLKPMLFYRFWRHSGPESGKSAKKCDFHLFSDIFMKFSENGLKSAIFTKFYHFGGESAKKERPQ